MGIWHLSRAGCLLQLASLSSFSHIKIFRKEYGYELFDQLQYYSRATPRPLSSFVSSFLEQTKGTFYVEVFLVPHLVQMEDTITQVCLRAQRVPYREQSIVIMVTEV